MTRLNDLKIAWMQFPDQIDYTSQGLKIEFSFCPNEEAAMGIILVCLTQSGRVVSLADSICRHPDVTLEPELLPYTILDLFLCYKLKYKSICKVTL